MPDNNVRSLNRSGRHGEIACAPPMACIANAIFNATGVRVNKLPLSPENVLRG